MVKDKLCDKCKGIRTGKFEDEVLCEGCYGEIRQRVLEEIKGNERKTIELEGGKWSFIKIPEGMVAKDNWFMAVVYVAIDLSAPVYVGPRLTGRQVEDLFVWDFELIRTLDEVRVGGLTLEPSNYLVVRE